MPTPRGGFGASVAGNGKFYAIGGQNSTGILSTNEEYDTGTNIWTQKSSMPTARVQLGVVTGPDGKIYAMGGNSGIRTVGTNEQYDPSSDTWSTKANMPTPRLGIEAVATNDGKIYAFGGYSDQMGNSTAVEVYDIASDLWTAKTDSPMQTGGYDIGGVFTSDGKIYIAGNAFSSVLQIYDIPTDTWTISSSSFSKRSYTGFTLGPDGNIYQIGGIDYSGNIVNTVEYYKPGLNTWVSTTTMPTSRYDLPIIATNGKIYAIGGITNLSGIYTGVLESATIAQENAPSIDSITYATVNVGDAYTANGSFTDSDSTSWMATVDYGDGSGTQPLTLSGMNFSLNHIYTAVGSYAITVTVTDNQGGSDQATATVTVQRQLVALFPSQQWIGLKNSDDVGLKFDLLAEVYKDATLVSSGQLSSVSGGSSGFGNAVLSSILFSAFTPVNFPQGSQLSIKLYVRNACVGSGHSSGTARLWFNDSAANSHFGAKIGASTNDYFLRDGFVLATTAGPGPKKTIDVAAGARCSSFKLLGTWTVTP